MAHVIHNLFGHWCGRVALRFPVDGDWGETWHMGLNSDSRAGVGD